MIKKRLLQLSVRIVVLLLLAVVTSYSRWSWDHQASVQNHHRQPNTHYEEEESVAIKVIRNENKKISYREDKREGTV